MIGKVDARFFDRFDKEVFHTHYEALTAPFNGQSELFKIVERPGPHG